MPKEVKNKVQYINIDELCELEHNPRKISRNDLEILMKSIQEDQAFFEARPIICNEINGKKIVVAGNQRLKASKELGFKEVPCVVFVNMSKEQQDKITIKDNVNNGIWDMEVLEAEFKDFDFIDVGLNINFDIKNIPAPDFTENIQVGNYVSNGTQEIPISQPINNNDIKQEQQGYPINNDCSNEETRMEKFVICPNCGEKIKL